MAATVIGLDVGTNAVRAVELELGDHPQILRMGQVGLPIGAVIDGEVTDAAAVSFALRRLWTEVGFKDRKVRVGMSSARVIVRTIEMPRVSHDELMSTIRLQLDDFVPLPPDETIFDVRTIDGPDDTASKTQQLLLAATHNDAVEPLMMALNGADLKVAAVDVIPAALAAAFTHPDPEQTDGVDVLLSIGAGTVVVVAARDGEALYSRTVTNVGGRRITERVAGQLSIGEADAERDKRSIADSGPTSAATMVAAASSIDELVGEVRASLAFYAGQTPTLPVRRLVVTGGGSLLVGLSAALEAELGLEIAPADPFAHFSLSSGTGFESCDLPYVAPYMAAALGVALRAGRPKDRRIDLSPVALGSGKSLASRKLLIGVGAVFLVGAGGAFFMQGRSAIAEEQTALEAAQLHLGDLQTQIAVRPTADQPTADATGPGPAAIAASVAGVDIDWLSVQQAVSAGSQPLGVVVSSFQGTLDPPDVAPVVAQPLDPASIPAGDGAPPITVAAVPTPQPAESLGPLPVGKLALIATAPGLTAIADWLDSIAADPRFADPWASGITMITSEDGSTSVQLTMEIVVTDANLVERAAFTEVAG